jgi:hypothetical protein
MDSDGEIITPEAMKAALPEYLKFGAVREMHGANAAGTAIEAEVRGRWAPCGLVRILLTLSGWSYNVISAKFA